MPESVNYHLERGRSPLNTLVSAILRQGMTLVVNDLEGRYGAKIDAALEKAMTELPS